VGAASLKNELSGVAAEGTGTDTARERLHSGAAWKTFQGICEAQGGMMEPPIARYREAVESPRSGTVTAIDNRKIAKTAKLAGAPGDKAAGVDLFVRIGMDVAAGDNVFEVHAESPGELAYSLEYLKNNPDVVTVV